MMKKLMAALAVCLVAGLALADNPYAASVVKNVAVAGTVYTNDLPVGGDNGYKAIEGVVFKNDTTNACTAVFYTVASSVATQFATSGSVAAGGSYVGYPHRVQAEGLATNLVPYLASDIRIIYTLGAANGAVVSEGLKATVFSK